MFTSPVQLPGWMPFIQVQAAQPAGPSSLSAHGKHRQTLALSAMPWQQADSWEEVRSQVHRQPGGALPVIRTIHAVVLAPVSRAGFPAPHTGRSAALCAASLPLCGCGVVPCHDHVCHKLAPYVLPA